MQNGTNENPRPGADSPTAMPVMTPHINPMPSACGHVYGFASRGRVSRNRSVVRRQSARDIVVSNPLPDDHLPQVVRSIQPNSH